MLPRGIDYFKLLMSGPSLELACFGLEAVELGCDAGVSRLELCSHRELDGLSPDEGMVESALRHRQPGKTRLMVMLRPDEQDTDLSEGRLTAIRQCVTLYRNSGIEGFVMGLATPDMELPVSVLNDLMALAPGMEWVFHRLIDRIPDPLGAMNQLAALGFHRILSSGSELTAMQGWPKLMAWQAALPKLEIMAGGGLRASHIRNLLLLYPSLSLWPKGGVHSSCLEGSSDRVNPFDLQQMMALCPG